MQIHGPSGSFDKIPVHLNGADGSFAVIEFGDASVYVETPADCDKIIKAAIAAKDLLTAEPAPAIMWAVVDALEGPVAGPMTLAEAQAYARDNGSYFIKELAVVPAAPELDEARAEQVLPGGYTLAASEVPAAFVSGLVGRLVEDINDDSPCPRVGKVIGQIGEETLEVLWDDEAHGVREFFDGLRPAREGAR